MSPRRSQRETPPGKGGVVQVAARERGGGINILIYLAYWRLPPVFGGTDVIRRDMSARQVFSMERRVARRKPRFGEKELDRELFERRPCGHDPLENLGSIDAAAFTSLSARPREPTDNITLGTDPEGPFGSGMNSARGLVSPRGSL